MFKDDIPSKIPLKLKDGNILIKNKAKASLKIKAPTKVNIPPIDFTVCLRNPRAKPTAAPIPNASKIKYQQFP
jgi:hypothetical protein